jgi:hypothetical protein
MKYYKGDIVEIVTSKYKNFGDWDKNASGYDKNIPNPTFTEFVGQRFIINTVGYPTYYDNKTKSSKEYYTFQEISSVGFILTKKSYEITLYKRPLINWVKYILNFESKTPPMK